MEAISKGTAIDQRQFRNALGAFATGVTIVTTSDGNGNDYGLTVNSFNSVSLDPPMVLWSLGRNSASLPAFYHASHFAVHVLSADQEMLSARFASKGIDKFSGIPLRRGTANVPLLDGCTARFECKTTFRYDGGDHEIFVGEVINFEHFDRPPLVYQAGGYAMLFKKPRRVEPKPEDQANDGDYNRNSLSYLCGVATHYLNEKSSQELARRGLTQLDAWVLNLLSEKEQQTIQDLDGQMGVSRLRVTPDVISRLIDFALITPVLNAGTEPRFRLTQGGREALLAFVAASKATEESAQEGLDSAEAQLLRTLLKRVIRELIAKHA